MHAQLMRANAQRAGRASAVKAAGLIHARQVAFSNAAKLTADELANVLGPVERAMDAFKQGRSTSFDWAVVTTALMMSQAIEDIGVTKGLNGHFGQIRQTLVALGDRIGDGPWVSPELYFFEIEALDLLRDLHDFQMRQVAFSEFSRALKMAEARVLAAGGKSMTHAAAMVGDLK